MFIAALALIQVVAAQPLPYPSAEQAAEMADRAAAAATAAAGAPPSSDGGICEVVNVWIDGRRGLRDLASRDLGSAEQYLRTMQAMPRPATREAEAWREAALMLAAEVRDDRRAVLEDDQFTDEVTIPMMREVCPIRP